MMLLNWPGKFPLAAQVPPFLPPGAIQVQTSGLQTCLLLGRTNIMLRSALGRQLWGLRCSAFRSQFFLTSPRDQGWDRGILHEHQDLCSELSSLLGSKLPKPPVAPGCWAVCWPQALHCLQWFPGTLACSNRRAGPSNHQALYCLTSGAALISQTTCATVPLWPEPVLVGVFFSTMWLQAATVP
jgi:hypothetical protein